MRHALRDVIGHCLYGVDVNEMAVELCKVNLWLEALEPGRPLSFLDQRIQCGNSLLGTTPALLRDGIPDEAFDPIEGDDPAYCRDLKRWNRDERKALGTLFNAEPWKRVGDLANGIAALEKIDDSTLEGVHQIETRYAELVRSSSYECGRLWADSWCAAFVWVKTKDVPSLTEQMFRIIEQNPMAAPEPLRNDIRRIAEQYRFFQWHLAFPEVFHVPPPDQKVPDGPGWTGGFDVVLGNPPWERIKIQEKEWFSERRPDIAEAPNAAARKRIIQGLKDEDPALWMAWCEAERQSDGEAALVRSTGRYPLCGRGDINTYSIFAELNRSLIGARGRAGFVVPTGVATDDTTKLFFQDLTTGGWIHSLYSFFEIRRIFIATDSRGPFCLLTLRYRSSTGSPAEFAFDLRSTSDLNDAERRFTLTADDIRLLNPNTRTCPIFYTKRDAELTKKIYRRIPVLIDDSKVEGGNLWRVSFLRMLDMANDSALFRTAAELEGDGWALHGMIFELGEERYLPLYEAKMFHQFNHRFGDYADKDPDDHGTALPVIPPARFTDPDYKVQPESWVPEKAVNLRLRDRWDRHWLLGWRRNARSKDERTIISSIVPGMGCGDSIFLLMHDAASYSTEVLVANMSSFTFDYVARQKLSGSNTSYYIFEQIPFLPPSTASSICRWAPSESVHAWVAPRVLELIYTAWDLQPFAADMKWNGPPFRWDTARRFLLRCELDAAFFHLYGVGRGDVDYIMDTFHIVRGDDQAAYSEHRTKRVILDIYDRMQRATETGEPYQTMLAPSPADPICCHPKKKVGVLAFGSLIHGPGPELKPKIAMRIKAKTPFAVHYLGTLCCSEKQKVIPSNGRTRLIASRTIQGR